MSSWDLIIIGGGGVGQILSMLAMEKKTNLKVLHLYHNELALPASHVPLALVSLGGIRSGVNPLGDQLVRSYSLAEKYFTHWQPPGVSEVEHMDLAVPNNDLHHQAFLSRHRHQLEQIKQIDNSLRFPVLGHRGRAFFIDTQLFLAWAHEFGLERGKVFEKSWVLDVQINAGEVQVLTAQKKIHTAKTVILCPGAHIQLLQQVWQRNAEVLAITEKCKWVSGGQWSAPASWGNVDQAWTLARANFFFHAKTQMIHIGSTTKEGKTYAPPLVELKKQYDLFTDLWARPLPPFSDGKIFTGLRLKGPGRRPWWGVVEKSQEAQIKAFLAPYKSGYLYPFVAADDLL